MELGLPLSEKRGTPQLAVLLGSISLSSAIKITTWVWMVQHQPSHCVLCSSSHTCMLSSAPLPACGVASSRAPSASTQVGEIQAILDGLLLGQGDQARKVGKTTVGKKRAQKASTGWEKQQKFWPKFRQLVPNLGQLEVEKMTLRVHGALTLRGLTSFPLP
jgi:hypothetical protein